jgi:hypothetical protein
VKPENLAAYLHNAGGDSTLAAGVMIADALFAVATALRKLGDLDPLIEKPVPYIRRNVERRTPSVPEIV